MDTTRTDIHRPSAIIPTDYQYVAVWTLKIEGLSDCDFIRREREISKAHMAKTGGKLVHKSHGSCGICGNVQAIYLVLFYHAKSNEYIVVGADCAVKLEMGFDEGAMSRFKRNVADAREAVAGKKKAIAILSDAGLIDAWTIFTAPYPKHADGCPWLLREQLTENWDCTCGTRDLEKQFDQYEERVIRDIVGKLVKYGSVSDAQKGFISKLLGNIARRPIIEAERKAEHEAAAPVEAGRYETTGTVLTIKEVEAYQFNRFSPETAWKVLIRLDNGAKVWGSRFANIEKGNRIRFTATFEVSKDDTKFGFFKRPVAWTSPEERILQVFSAEWPAQEEVIP